MPAFANPQGGQVVGGQATIAATAPNTLTIQQTTPKAAINWQSFDIAPNETTQFVQPSASAIALNRVQAGDPSVIAGRLTANGQLILINPNGILFTKGSQVDVNSLLATPSGISTANFMAGRMVFDQPGNPNAQVINNGSITVGQAGLAALVAPGVANNGVIAAKLGNVVLGGAQTYTLDFYGDGLIQFNVGAPVSAAPLGPDGKPMTSLVSNSGTIDAPGGTVLLSADAVAGVLRHVVTAGGTIATPSVTTPAGNVTIGKVTIDAGAGNAAELSGRINVSGLRPGQSGGNAVVSGGSVDLAATARIDARGASSGGNVTIGGGTPGAGSLMQSALTTNVSAGAVIDASATQQGNGGTVRVLSDTTTTFAGTIRANGGPLGGDGGLVETSGGQVVLGPAVSVSAAAPHGKAGTWLLDPTDLTIDATAATTISNTLNGGTDVTEQTAGDGTTAGFGTQSSGAGDIDVTGPIEWFTGNTLTLSAFNGINISAPILVDGGGTLVLTLNNNIGGSSSGAGALAFLPGSGSVQFTGGSSAGAALYINNGTPTTGNGTQYTLIYDVDNDPTGLQSLAGSSGNFALAVPLDASMLNGGNPLTGTLISSFGGTFNGLGNAILNLTISTSGDAGLFDSIASGATVTSLGIIGGSIAGGDGANVGALAASNSGTIANSYATASVSGGDGSFIGGLVGGNSGAITGSSATGTVTAGSGGDIGGLVGDNAGAIAQSFATGAVTVSGGRAGGLVGIGTDTITDAYATGSVTCSGSGCSTAGAGGLVGFQIGGTITNAFATGAVSGAAQTGGFAGANTGTITNGYWDTTTTGAGSGVAGGDGTGVTGLTTAELAGQGTPAGLPSGFSATLWDNVHNQTTPYLLANPGPVYLGSDNSATPTAFTPILNMTELQAIANFGALTGNYVLANDIDATGYGNFVPIGSVVSGDTIAFRGIFDGLGNVVANLAISTTATDVGLFGASSGIVRNLGLIGETITGGAASTAVGGLVGDNSGIVANAYATGTVDGSAGGGAVGGLVGLNDSGTGTVQNSYTTGAVIGGTGNVGGLVGENDGTVQFAYSIATVSGAGGNIGGLIGLDTAPATTLDVYAAGPVSGTGAGGESVGGLIGTEQGSLSGGYWDDDRAVFAVSALGPNSTTGSATELSSSGASPFSAGSYSLSDTFVTSPSAAAASNWVIVDTDGTLNGSNGGTLPMLASEWQTAIQNPHQLQLMALDLGNSYTLGRTMDATATGSSTIVSTGSDVWGTSGFIPIGGGVSGFAGDFNGAGHTIANLTIVDSASNDTGLFTDLTGSGTVENVGLVGLSLTATSSNPNAGGLVGGNSGIIANSFVTGSVNGGATNAGGLVGDNGGSGQVETSYSTASVSGQNAGGLVGENDGSVTNAYATGGVSGGIVGGLVGVNTGTLTNVYATGALAGGPDTGGVIGLNNSIDPVTNAFWDSVTTFAGAGVGSGTDTTTQVDTPGLASATTLTVLNGNGVVWGNANNTSTPYLLPYSPGNPQTVYLASDTSNTPTAYTLVFDLTQLQNIANNLGGNFALAQNLDATGISGFNPIGCQCTPFSGTFNGNGNVIANLTISTIADDAGLFGNSAGLIENIGLIGETVSDDQFLAIVGGLAGVVQSGAIVNSYATGAVSSNGAAAVVGGLVGILGASATIDNSYTAGTVTATDGASTAGGLLGANFGTVQFAYSVATVTGGNTVGGLIGSDQGFSTLDVYAAGAVAGTGPSNVVGGLIGDEAGTLSGGYWDSDRSAPGTTALGSASTAGAPTTLSSSGPSSPFSAASYNSADFTFVASPSPGVGTNWVIVQPDGSLAGNSSTGGATLPMLASEYQTTIQNAHQLQLIALDPTAGYTLARSVDASATGSSLASASAGTDVWGSAGFVPVALTGGVFDGAGHTIANLAIDSGASGVGLFGSAAGTIENVGLLGGSATGSADFASVGALVGDADGVAITNSYATGTVTSTGNSAYTGGLVGSSNSAGDMITTSYATGAVSANGGFTGGLIGYNTGTIGQSYAAGTVTAGNSAAAGGLAGVNQGTITQAFASGAVDGSGGFVGGFVGSNNGMIADSYATGPVTAAGFFGGFVGANNGSGTIIDAYATGAVTFGGGGFVAAGGNGGTFIDVYYDADTTGSQRGSVDGSIGLTTAQLQATPGVSGAFNLASDFQTPGNWNIIAGKSYPYLCFLFSNCAQTPQVVTGTVFVDNGQTLAGSGIAVSGLVDGTPFVSVETGGAVVTGANGYYYFLTAPNTVAAGQNVLTLTTGLGSSNGAALADQVASANPTGLDIYLATLHEITSQVFNSTVQADLAAALGGNATALAIVPIIPNLQIDASGAFFAVDGTISYPGTVTLNAPGGIVEPGGIVAAALAVTAQNSVDLAGTNLVGTVAASLNALSGSEASFDLLNGQGLTVGTVGTLNGVTTNNGNIVLRTAAGGDITIAAPLNSNNGAADLSGAFAQIGLFSTGNITQTSVDGIVAPDLEVRAARKIDLIQGDNVVQTFAAKITGGQSLSLFDLTDLTIGSLQVSAGSLSLPTLAGVTTNGGDITLEVVDGALRLNKQLNTNDGSTTLGTMPGDVSLSVDGDITQSTKGAHDGRIIARQLDAESNFGSVLLTAANHLGDTDVGGIATDPGALAGSAAGDFEFVNNNAGITVKKLDCGCEGISAFEGNIGLATTGAGDITVKRPIATLLGEIAIAVAPGSSFVNTTPFPTAGIVTFDGGPITILADQMTLAGGTINAGSGNVVLGPASTSGVNIALGAAGGAGTLGLRQADLDSITAGALQIGYDNRNGSASFSGDIDIAGTIRIDTDNVQALQLVTGNGGVVTESGGAIVGTGAAPLQLGVLADTITMDQNNAVGTLAAVTIGAISFVDKQSLTVGTLSDPDFVLGVRFVSGVFPAVAPSRLSSNPLSGITTANDDVALTVAGDLSIDAPISVGTTSLTGSLTAIASGSISETANGVITADTLVAETKLRGGGAITLTNASNAINNVTLTALNAGGGQLAAGAIDFVDSSSFTIVFQSGLQTGIATTGGATLESSGGISDAGGTVTADNLSVIADGGAVSLTTANSANTLTGSAAGDFRFINAGGLTVGAAGIIAGNLDQITLQTNAGDLTIAGPLSSPNSGMLARVSLLGTGGSIIEAAGGSITTTQLAATTLLDSGGAITLDQPGNAITGDINLISDRQTGLQTPAAGPITLFNSTATSLSDVTTLGSFVVQASGSITQPSGGSNVSVGSLVARTMVDGGADIDLNQDNSVSGSVTLTALDSLGQILQAGNITLNTGGGVTIASVAGGGVGGLETGIGTTGTVGLSAGGAVTEASGAVITADALSGRSVGGATLTGANRVGSFGGWSDSGSGPGISFTNAAALQTAGFISSDNDIALTTTAGGLVVGTGSGDRIESGGTVTLTAAGAIGETSGAAITGSNLIATTQVAGGATITLLQPGNTITGNVTLTSLDAGGTNLQPGTIQFADSTGFTIASNGATQPGIATDQTGAVGLTSGGAISENPGAIVSAATLTVTSSGAATVDQDNNVQALLGFANTGASGDLVFNTVTNTSNGFGVGGTGVSNPVGNVTLSTQFGDFAIVAPIVASGTVSLSAGGQVFQPAIFGSSIPPGTITAPAVVVIAGASVDLSGPNQVGTLAASVTGSGNFAFTTGSTGLTVDTVNGVSGIQAPNVIRLTTTSGDITLNQQVNATGPGDVILNSAGRIVQGGVAGVITADTLSVTAGSDVQLNTAANNVNTATGTAGGEFVLLNAGALTVGASGILSGNGEQILLTTNVGDLTIAGPLAGISAAAGSVGLSAGGNIIETDGGSIVAGSLSAQTELDGGGAISLTTASNAVGSVTLSSLKGAGMTLDAGEIDFADSTDFLIAAGSGLRTGIATTGLATLLGGSIGEAGGATIVAGSLAITSSSSVDLPNANAVGTLAAKLTAPGSSFDFVNGQTLTVGAAGGVNGVTTDGTNGTEANILIETTAGDIDINQQISTNGASGNTLVGSLGEIGLQSAGAITLNQSGNAGNLVGFAVEAIAAGPINLDGSANAAGNRIGANDDSTGTAQTAGTFVGQVTGAGNALTFADHNASLTIGQVSDGTNIGVAAGSLQLPLVSGVTTNGGAITLGATNSVGTLTTLSLALPVNANNGASLLGVSPGPVVLISAGGDITQTSGGIIIAGQLYADSGLGSVVLTAANHVGAHDNDLGIAATPGLVAGTSGVDFLFRNDSAGIQVDTVAGIPGIFSGNGVSTPIGDTRLLTTTAGDITIDQPINSGNAIEIAAAPGYRFTNNVANNMVFGYLSAGVDTTFAGAPIVILADQMSLANGTINAGSGTVVLGPASGSGVNVALGAAGSIGTLGLQQADFASISAAALQIGYRNPNGTPSFSGGIDVAGSVQIDTASIPVLLLVTGGAVTESGGAITFTGSTPLQLGVLAGSAVLNQNNAIGTLAAYTDGTTPNFSFANDNQTLAIGTLSSQQLGVQGDSNGFPILVTMTGAPPNPLSGITTGNGNIAVTSAGSGGLTIGTPIDAGGGTVTAASAGALTIGSGGTVTGGAVTLATLTGFTNTAGPSAITVPGDSQWLIYSPNPGADSYDGLVPGFIQYAASYPVGTSGTPTAPAASGDGVLYSQAPSVTVSAVTKIYDGTTALPTTASAYTFGGAVNGDGVLLNPGAATGSYMSANAASGIDVTLTGVTLSASNGGIPVFGYGIAAANGGAIGTITAKALTAGLTGTVSKIYDGTTAATLAAGNYTLAGLVSGDSVGLNDPTAGTYASKNVATGIGVGVSGLALTGSAAANYTLASTSLSANIGTITPATLTAGLTGTASKVYDGTTAATLAAGNYTLAGVVSGDSVSLNDPTAGTYASKNVATGIGVGVSGLALTGSAAGNYMLASTSLSANVGTITPATLTAGLTGTVSKVYDGTTVAMLTSGNYVLPGVIGADSVSLNDPTTGAYGSKNVAGNIEVSVSGLTLNGADAGNYVLASSSANAAIGAITPANLTAMIVGNPTKTYDGTIAATLAGGNYSLGGFVSGEGASVTQTAGSYATANAGSVAVTASLGAANFSANGGTLLSNYTLPVSATGTGTITQATLTAGLTGTVSKVYDGTTAAILAAGNYTLAGVVSGDTVSLNDPTAGTYASKNVAPVIGVGVSGLALTGSAAGNYTLASTSLSANIGTITPAPLTATIVGNPTKTYDGTVTATLAAGNYSLGGFVSGEGASVTQAAGSYATANAGSVAVTASLGAANFSANGGTLLSNYALPVSATGTGTITPATLTAGLTGTVNKVYDGTTAAMLAAGNYTLAGVVSGDSVSLNDPTTGVYASKNVAPVIGVSVSGLALTGSASGNYMLASTSLSAAIGTITPATLTAGLTGTVSKVFDGTTVAMLAPANYTLSGGVSGDTVDLNAPAAGTYASANVGTGIGVMVSGLALSGASAGNYMLASTSASAAIGIITGSPPPPPSQLLIAPTMAVFGTQPQPVSEADMAFVLPFFFDAGQPLFVFAGGDQP